MYVSNTRTHISVVLIQDLIDFYANHSLPQNILTQALPLVLTRLDKILVLIIQPSIKSMTDTESFPR